MDATGSYVRRVPAWLGLSLLFAQTVIGQDRGTALEPAPQGTEAGMQIQQGTLLQVELTRRTDWKHLARNSVVEGRLMLPAFAGNDIAISEGTKVDLTIESVRTAESNVGKWRKAGNAVVRAFNPLEKGRPAEYVIHLSKTEAETPQGSMVVAATALRAGYAAMIEPKIARGGEVHTLQPSGEKSQGSKKGRQTIVLQFDEGVLWTGPRTRRVDTVEESRGRKVRAFLLTQLSASQSRKDDVFQARLAEPVRVGDKSLAAGSLLEGRVSQSKRPRMLSRAGSLYLRIERITSRQGASLAVDGTLGGVETDAGAKYALDEEGGLHGLRPGFTNALVDLSIAYALGKVTDDIAETPIRAVGAAMSNAAVANAARYFGLGASAVFLVTRHGRDVCLPRYSEIEIDFGRFSERASASARFQP
jgi:hypothetical protein